ncbi:MAG: hypothetical protein ACOYI8_05215 [Christensenellales bacterium]|jgi:hypothetical protein
MKYIRRFLWFVAKRLLLVSILFSILILTFYISMNAANIYILLDDGMAARAKSILTREDAQELTNFFTDDFLAHDDALNLGLSAESPYVNYNIADYDSSVSLEWVWTWPWEDTAQATIVYRLSGIKGSVVSGKSALVKSGALSETPPEWQTWRYDMTLLRTNGQWKIAGMRQTQYILDATPAPVATLSPAREG